MALVEQGAVPEELSGPDVVQEQASDPLVGDPRLPAFFGPSWSVVDGFHALLASEAVTRGLIGPREPARLWERHLLNSASVVPALRGAASVLDLGSGAGLPGIVVAAMCPDVAVTLLEPMERRCVWLREVVDELGLRNTTVRRARAEEVAGLLTVDAITVRAVGGLDRLYRWSAPLLRKGGRLVALKGDRAEEEVASASTVGARLGFGRVAVSDVATLEGVAMTRVVVAYKDGAARGTR